MDGTNESHRRVLRVLIAVVSDQRRGAEVEASVVAAALRDSGVDVELVALQASEDSDRLGAATLGRAALAPSTLWRLRKLALERDVTIAYGSRTLPASAIALALSKSRFIYRSIGDPSYWLRSRFHRYRTGLLFRRAAKVVALWTDAAASIELLYRVPQCDIEVIPNSRNLAAFSPATARDRRLAREALNLDAESSVVAVIGSLSPEKHVALAIEAVAETDAYLLIVGDGPCRRELEAIAAENLPNRHRLLGVVRDVAMVYQAADSVLLTSESEGMPGVLIEAALCGTPFAAASVGAVRWIAEQSGMGETFEATAGPIEIARCLRSLASQQRSLRADFHQLVDSANAARLWRDILNSVAREGN